MTSAAIAVPRKRRRRRRRPNPLERLLIVIWLTCWVLVGVDLGMVTRVGFNAVLALNLSAQVFGIVVLFPFVWPPLKRWFMGEP